MVDHPEARSGSAPRDRIELRGVRLLGIHGTLPEEQDRAQPFEVDLDLFVDLASATGSDDVGDTVDYGAVTALVAAVVTGKRCLLLERLADRIASEVLASDARVASVTVAVRKLRPPVAVDMTSAGVRLTRDRGATSAGPARRRQRAFLSMGSNLGDRLAMLRGAIAKLPDVVAVSPVYETEPVGGPDDQAPFLNVVVELSTELTPRELLQAAHRLESEAERVRTVRFGPRTLDVDLLLVGDVVVDEEDLVLPHPRMHARRFVLAPLSDLAPELVPDGWEAGAIGAVRRVGYLSGDPSRSSTDPEN